MAQDYPRERVEDVLVKTALPPSHRTVPLRHIATPLGTAPADSRFCTKTCGYTVLYAAPDFATAFVETVVRDRFTFKRPRRIALVEVTGRAWARIETKPDTQLHLLDLRGDGCVRLGAPTDAVNARIHAAGRALGRAIHRGHPNIDGLLYASRLTGKDAYALFDRAVAKLTAPATGPLADHPDLPGVLTKYGIELEVS